MEMLILYLTLAVVVLKAHKIQVCPKRCVCQVLSPNLATLCDKKGLLFVPPNIDRHTMELRLGDNFVTGIKRRDFANMTRLVDLTLSRNTIGSISPHAFDDLENLRALHLDSNRLTHITNDTFSGMSKLHHLILNNNQLTRIHVGAFDALLALEELDLSYNNLQSAPWIAIQQMFSLHTLNLDHNMLEHIPEGTFSGLQKLKRLDVTSNKLHKLPPDPVFQRAGVLATSGALGPASFALSFGGNPLHCNCELLWLRRLRREDDLETCAAPSHLAGRYFWTVSEEEFVCEPPLITRHSQETRALEGQQVSLRCKARGDPEPVVHWIGPDGKLVFNSGRAAVRADGTLDILITTVKDSGSFTCVASNPSGEAQQTVELLITKLPHFTNHTSLVPEPDPGSSDIATSAQGGTDGGLALGGAKSAQEKRVLVSEITSSTALVKFNFQRNIPGIRMFQVQYNGTYDDSLVYRMIPPASKSVAVNNLAAGTLYDLCVLAIYDDAVTTLTGTRVVGCVHFSTEPQYLRCHFMQSQFLGGTIVVIIGGVIVASVLAFIIFLIVRYRVCHQQGAEKGVELGLIRTQSRTEQLQVCGIIKSISKHVLGPDRDSSRKVSPQSDSVALQRVPKSAFPDCTVTTSAASHSWHPASPNQPRPPRPDPKSPEPDGLDRNNSAKLRPPPAPRAYSTLTTPSQRRAQLQNLRSYQTVPASCVRVSRRHSLDVDSCPQPLARPRCPPAPGSLRSARSLSMSGGDIPQLDVERRNESQQWLVESAL